MGDIVIVASRGGSINTEYLNFQLPDIDFSGLFLTASMDTPIGLSSGPNDKRDYTFEKTGNKPVTNVEDATHNQLAGVAQVLDNAERTPELARTFKEMADKNITLNVRIVDTAPAHFGPDQIAGVTADLTEASALGPDELEPGSIADIIVVASRLDPPSGHYNFNFVLAHEFGHLMRDQNSEFMKEPALDPVDDQIYEDLFRGFKPKNFIESRDISMQDHEFTAFGDTWKAFGTDGNNYIDSFQATNDEIHTGHGNDVLLSRGGMDKIFVANTGVKYVVDYGLGPDDPTYPLDQVVFEGVSMSSLIATRIGSDAYITYANNGINPLFDDNTTIIAGYYANPGSSSIEIFGTSDGGFAWAWDLLGPPDTMSSARDHSLSPSGRESELPQRELVAVWQPEDPTQGVLRSYKIVPEYNSFSEDDIQRMLEAFENGNSIGGGQEQVYGLQSSVYQDFMSSYALTSVSEWGFL